MSYGQLTSIRVAGDGFEREYPYPTADDGAAGGGAGDGHRVLGRFHGAEATHVDWFGTDSAHVEIAERMERTGAAAESVIILAELLDDTHFDDERYVILHDEQLVSELRETAFRHFDREINDEMAAWLEDHADPDDHHLEQVIAKYEQRVLPILEDQYREFEMSFDRNAVTRPRRQTRRERRYLLPAPFDFWDARNPWQQYFFILGAGEQAARAQPAAGRQPTERAESPMSYARSGSGGSSQRGQHTIFGLAFALRDVARPIPTHILVYDRHNRLVPVDSLDRLCLVASDLGSNYALPHARVSELTQHALRCTWATQR